VPIADEVVSQLDIVLPAGLQGWELWVGFRRRRSRWNASALPERGNPAVRHRGRARAGNRAVLASTLPRQSHRPPQSRGVEVARKRRLAKWLRALGAGGGQEETGQQVGGGGEQVTSGVEGHACGLQGRLGRAIRQAALVGLGLLGVDRC